jgi:aryl-alcohol dehydrogenase-like predicted oxidoreductase
VLSKHALGGTGLEVSRVALAGSFGIDAKSTERAFHELGVNTFFVSSRMKGLMEGVKNLVAGGHRDRLIIVAGAAIPMGYSVTREFNQMCRALDVETIDVFLLYWVQAHWYVTGKTWPAMRKLKEEGKARSLGISCHDRPMARELVDELSLDALMIRYNAAHRDAEKEIFDTLDSSKTGVIAYTATRWGRLLKPLNDLGPMSGPECYRFVLGHPSVSTVLCGARSYEEIEAAAREAELGPLAPARLDEVRRFGDAVRSTATGRMGFMGT